MILFHAADLIWATKIKAAADAAGLLARPVRTLDMLEARLADSPVRALVVDLDAPDTALALIRRVRHNHRTPPIRVLAYGPHVAVEQFEAARAAGADRALARGAFDARLGEILASLLAADSAPR